LSSKAVHALTRSQQAPTGRPYPRVNGRHATLQADCFYDLGVPDSDEEIELGGYASDVSGVSSLWGSAISGGSDINEAGAAQMADAASSPAPDAGLLARPAKAAREDKTPKVRQDLDWLRSSIVIQRH
jgi:hypothetical protein